MIVLDASALVDVVTDQPAKPAVLEHLEQPIAAPGHQLAEVLSAVARMARGGLLDAEAAAAAVADAAALSQNHVPLDDELLARALVLNGRLRALDGLYVALAERLACPLLTTDVRLKRADPPCEVIVAEAVDVDG
ncbi:type II toxin-antitoxin system VapC family toxin [Nocardioides carbamazepini]|uniref:type II toxin-antitoxin system VapC family toxin n=1 Tax=Nocardioides carbamazepini TaxID=2854259 RepID=UPI00214A0DEE|nr:type II toxin-antitoxin system VapC family toxin [Nocardioides carbamazepini]MCR1786036.1 type II toxin-antitoxin system VapC family toxin [Nocardioides carbamazepini]